MSKPTILLVPGAWFPAVAYEPLLKTLRESGYPTETTDYPSLNPTGNPSEATCAADAEYIRKNAVHRIIEKDGKDVVLLMHSYAGMPGAAAAYGLSKRQRQRKGKEGGVVGLIMVSAFVINEGISCAGGMGGDTPPWVLKDNPKKDLCSPKNPKGMFAADVEPDAAEAVVEQLVTHATVAFFSPQPPPAFAEPDMEGLNAYIMLLQDQAVPLPGQEAMMQYSGQQWITKKLELSHNAGFISKTNEMLGAIDEIILTFQRKLMLQART